MSTADDLPWPELGNVSRGATRGNQGQKGVLGPPDREGRCILQLRVQPGVLAVRLNRQASDWYRTLDNEVNRALKMTKTYWRKARRRQDYDARADQDHMELHEWLQQLKDKTMSHLELLMQKGDIQGPPYSMPDDVELTFLRRFIERQAAGISHNPRLRNEVGGGGVEYIQGDQSSDSFTPEPQSFMDHHHHHRGGVVPHDKKYKNAEQSLQAARSALTRAQKDTQEAYMRYTSYRELEQQAQIAVTNAEKRRDDIMALILAQNQMPTDDRSRRSSISGDDSPPRYPMEEVRTPVDPFMNARVGQKPIEWPSENMYSNEQLPHIEDQTGRPRKHSRTWEHPPQLHDTPYSCEVQVGGGPDYGEYRTERQQYTTQDMTTDLPPRKRIHHGMISGFDIMNGTPLQAHNMTLQS